MVPSQCATDYTQVSGSHLNSLQVSGFMVPMLAFLKLLRHRKPFVQRCMGVVSTPKIWGPGICTPTPPHCYALGFISRRRERYAEMITVRNED